MHEALRGLGSGFTGESFLKNLTRCLVHILTSKSLSKLTLWACFVLCTRYSLAAL